MLIPKLLWPLLIYDITASALGALARKISVATRKGLGLPPGLPDVVPFKFFTEAFKVVKVRLATLLGESTDPNTFEPSQRS